MWDLFCCCHQLISGIVIEDLMSSYETFGVVKEKSKGALKFYETLLESIGKLRAHAEVRCSVQNPFLILSSTQGKTQPSNAPASVTQSASDTANNPFLAGGDPISAVPRRHGRKSARPMSYHQKPVSQKPSEEIWYNSTANCNLPFQVLNLPWIWLQRM